MNPERWRQVETLYHAASMRPAEERPAFLAEACRGDEGLREVVESLLDAPATADEVLADAGAAAVTDHTTAAGPEGAAAVTSRPCSRGATRRLLRSHAPRW